MDGPGHPASVRRTDAARGLARDAVPVPLGEWRRMERPERRVARLVTVARGAAASAAAVGPAVGAAKARVEGASATRSPVLLPAGEGLPEGRTFVL